MGKRLSPAEWNKTPYADTEAKETGAAIERLLAKYKVVDIQTTQCKGPNGRRAYSVRFNLRDHTYRVAVESLDVWGIDPERTYRQAQRAVYWILKTTLEMADVFLPTEQALYAFLELPDGRTMYEWSGKGMANLLPADFSVAVGAVTPKLLTDQRTGQ